MATEEIPFPESKSDSQLEAQVPAPRADAPESERPKRARKTRAAADEATEAEPAPKRTRSRRAAASKDVEDVSPEVAQARALAQISQAQVAREERSRVERTSAMIEVEDKDEAPVSAPAKRATTRRKKAVEAVEPATEPETSPSAAKTEDEAPVPRRRTRKPKAALAEGDGGEKSPKAKQRAAESVDAVPDAVATVPASPGGDAPAQKRDVDMRPGRARRVRKKADADGSAAVSEESADASSDVPRGDSGSEGDAKQGEIGEKEEPRRQQDGEGTGAEEGHASKRRQHQNRRERQERNDRRSGKQSNRKQRGNNSRYNAPTEPSLSREELSAMKVAELREKGRELELDVSGKKKAELVEEIYTAAARAEGFRDIEGILDISREGFGYIRAHGYMPSREDAFVPANMVRAARLRAGDVISGTLRPSRANDKFPGLAKIKSINGKDPEELRHRPKFSELTPIYPNEPLKMEHGRDSITGRAIDIVSPIGKGQRGLIVSPPKAGKTTILKKICQSIAANNPEVHLICLLVDERPEEVTDMQRSIKGDVVASTFDMPADNHTRVSELVIERAKRIVEMGGDVVVVLDSITRLARAYNLAAPASGRILSGGVDSAALYPPKRFLGAARNIENGGSLTILASALVDTGSKMDEVIFEEFKGTGNMELKLDRDLADRRIFPAIDPVASGTRNEDLLVDENMRPFVWGIRRILANMNNTERAAASFIKGLKGTKSNEEFLIRSAKKAADHEASM